MNKQITIITPNRNKELYDIEGYLDNICRHGCPIIFVDDNSDKEKLVGLKELIDKYREKYDADITTFFSEERLYIGGGVAKCLEMTKTAYCMRVDSDDRLFNLPPIVIDTETDIYIPELFPDNIMSWVKTNKHIQAIVFKTSVLTKIYTIHEMFSRHQEEIPEDGFFFAYGFLNFDFVYKKVPYSQREIMQRIRTENSIMRTIRSKHHPKQRFSKMYHLLFEKNLVKSSLNSEQTFERIMGIMDFKTTIKYRDWS